MTPMDDTDRRLLELVQSDFPLDPRPYAVLGGLLGCPEDEALARMQRLCDAGIVRQIGAVFNVQKVSHTSTLCGAEVAPESVEAVAAFLNAFEEVTHNYLRENRFNIWFTLIAPSELRIEQILAQVREQPGVRSVMSLPAEKTFKIKVHFAPSGESA